VRRIDAMDAASQARFDRAQAQVMWVLWLTYGAFYFCRNNLSAAVPGMEGELHLTKAEIGGILGALKISYGIGQLVNGQLAERIGARRLLAIGMLVSAGLNVVFGLVTGFYFLLFIWACNGYFQALGWPPTMRVAARWFAPAQRGRAISIIGTGYQLAGALTFVVAGWSAQWLGWRGALYVPAILLAAAAVYMLATLREAPDEGSEPVGTARATPAGGHRPWLTTVGLTLSNGRLWFLAISLGLLNACRYGFLDWGISHLMEVQKGGIGVSALKYSVLPLGGIVGTLAAGWATDRYFRGRRVPVICGMLLVLALLALGYDAVVRTNLVLSIVTLGLIGAMIFGPQVLLVGTAPVDLARRGSAAAAVGFVNFVGYLGAATGDQVTGYLVHVYDWHAAVYFWSSCALGAAVVAAPLWRAIAEHDTE
jgi:sugar phosphate permease